MLKTQHRLHLGSRKLITSHVEMDDIDDFDAIFGSDPVLAYNSQTIDHILRNRRTLDNELFFDRLLKAIGIHQGRLKHYRAMSFNGLCSYGSASKSYPPRSNQDLRNLHERIVTSSAPDHHQQSLLYYILHDIPSHKQSAESFAKKHFLPTRYRIFVEGIWCLDRLMFEVGTRRYLFYIADSNQRALDYLAEPCLIPTFSEEILYTLCQHGDYSDVTLPLAYYHAVSPIITSNKVLEAFYDVQCRASITEALYFSRSHGEPIHEFLFEKLIDFIHANSAGETRAARAVEFISLPFNEAEEIWLEQYLASGKGSALQGANDTLMMRKLATGRSQDAMDFGRNLNGQKINGVNWTVIKDSLQAKPKP